MFFKRFPFWTARPNTPKGDRRKRTWLGFCGESLTALVISGLVLFCIAFVAILWAWSQRDQFLTAQIRKAIQEKFPEWNVSFDSAELDHRGRVVLSNVVLNPHSSATPLCSVQGLRVTVDRDLLLNQQQIDIQAIEVNRPQLTVVRERSGQWNWENLPFPDDAGGSAPPLVKIRDAQIAVQWEHIDFERAFRVQVAAVDVDMVPDGQHRYRFEGVGREETLGSSQFSGLFDTLHKTWELSGNLKGLNIDQPLLQAAALISPDANRMMVELKKSHIKSWQQEEAAASKIDAETPFVQVAGLNHAPQSAEIQTTSIDAIGLSQSPAASTVFSLKLMANLQFHASRQTDKEPDFTLFAELVNGQLEHPDLPLPLDKIEGQIAIDKIGIRIDQMLVASGVTSAELTGAWNWNQEMQNEALRDELLITLKNYRITPQTRDFLPTGLRNLYDELSPAGQISIAFGVRRGTDRPIDFDLFNAEVRDSSIQHEMFSYPVQEIRGTIVRTDHGIGPEAWELDFTGVAAGRSVTATGTLLDPGPHCETAIEVHVAGLAIDEQFYRALRPKERGVMEYIGLTGTADINCMIVRKLSYGRKPIIRLDADVYDAALQVKSFPLSVRQLSGHINSDENGWQLTRLTGVHGDTQINGFGTVIPDNEDWKLDLTLAAQQAHFDHDLYLALKKASTDVAKVWDILRPRGNFGINLNVGWHSGTDLVQVAVPLMKLQHCEITPTVFPWRISDIVATVAVEPNGVVTFENLNAKHNQCQMETTGSFSPRQDYWQLRFDDLVLDDLMPDHEFMAALPQVFRKMLETVQLRQSHSMTGMLEFKGDYGGQVVTAAWDTEATLNQVDLFMGVDLKNVSGKVKHKGSMDRSGIVTIDEGRVELDSCWVMGYHVTDIKGPFRVEKDQIVLGSAKMFEAESPEDDWATVSRQERITGRIFNGELFLDLLAKRTNAMPYWLRCTLSRADLEQWAIQSNYGQANIRGEMNGYIDLAGDSVSSRNTVGNGRLLISPAALYELPVMLQMFQSLRFAPVDETAFRDAYAQFRILDEKFVFDEIGLLGDSISLFGQGTIRFDRTMDLDFVYRPPRRNRVNPVSQVLNRLEGVLPVLFTVDVEGTLDVPKITVQDGVRETLRGFGKMLEAGPAGLRPPRITPPPRIQIQTPPQAAQPLIPAF